MPPRRHLCFLPVLLGIVLPGVLLLTSCDSDAWTTRSTSQNAATPPSAASAKLGDLRDVDPCALTDSGALRGFGDVSRTSTVSLDHCVLNIGTSDGSRMQLAVGDVDSVNPRDAANPVTRRGSLSIEQLEPLPGHCDRRIRFSDGLALRVSADLLDGRPGTGLCGLAQAGAEQAVTVIDQGRVGHRQTAPNSLTKIDPCSVLNTDDVRQIPGMDRVRALPEPAGHRCRWGEQAADEPRVTLTHTAGAAPAKTHDTAVEEQVSGRRTVIGDVGGDPTVPLCSAETGHIPFGRPDSGEVEVAQLVVALPGSTGIDACEFARGLAERTWPHLPSA